jgi:hypothetical protein
MCEAFPSKTGEGTGVAGQVMKDALALCRGTSDRACLGGTRADAITDADERTLP